MAKMKNQTAGIKSKSKTKVRWKKGQSSSSNPETKKHRNAAKNRFFDTSTGQSPGPNQLTVSALEKHDEEYSHGVSKPDLDAATFKTWATHYTECTNTTFNKVHQNWNNDAMQKEVLAVLAAVTEIIKTQGGQETEAEYFAILMTTLETTEDTTGLSATLYLLNLVLKKLPRTILQAKFGNVSMVLMKLIERHAASEGAALISKLISCLTTLLRYQDMATWTQPSTTTMYHSLLSFSSYSKPKVRKAVREAVVIVLKGSEIIRDGTAEVHPAASVTEKYCIEHIQQLLNRSLIQKSKDTSIYSDVTHTLQLIKDVIGCFPKSSLKTSCELVLRLMALSNVVLKGVCLEVLNSLFCSEPPVERFTTDLNARVITALYDFLPNVNDIQMMPAWLLVMENALINLGRNDESLCLSHLPRFVSSCLKCLLAERMESMTAAAVTLKCIIMQFLGSIPADRFPDHLSRANAPLPTVIAYLTATLGYQYHASWSLVLQVWASMFEVMGSHCPEQFSRVLKDMSELRENPEFGYKAELDRAVGSAVRYMGPRAVLTAIPLEFSVSGNDVRRSWLMPILSNCISHTELAFFLEYFLPLAAKCRKIAAARQETGDIIQQKVHETLVVQIWGLLPAFCTKPTDLLASFKNLAKTLGQTISERADLRSFCLSGLRKLIHFSKDDDEYRPELAKYAKNYLPILFNIFTADPSEGAGSRVDQQVVLDTIREYMQLTDQKLVHTYFDKCLDNVTENTAQDASAKFKRNALLDLAISMVHYVDIERLTKICSYVTPLLQGADKTLQKKGYRFLDSICTMKTATCSEFLSQNLQLLQTMLLSNLSTSNSSSKGPRLRCLINIFKMMDSENRDFLVAVLPEAILCTREIGEAARKNAYDLLVTMCEANIGWHPDGELNSSVMDFLQMMVAGLAGSPSMIHCTVLAITRIVFEYRKMLTSDNLVVVMEHCCSLIKSKSREVVTPALSLLKVIIGSFDVTVLARYLQPVCESLAHMKEDNRHHVRFKVKEILERVVRKFGFETVHKLLPEAFHKQLVNVRKAQERKKRESVSEKHSSKQQTDDGEDESLLQSVKKSQPESIDELLRDSDSEMDTDDAAGGQSKKAKSAVTVPTWLRDDSDNITDFLDKSAAKNIIASRPTVRRPEKSKELSEQFKTGADGRMVITELEEDQPVPTHRDDGQAELDDIDDIFEQFEMQAGKKSKKRKIEMMSESASQISASTYAPGGRGIHRPLANKKGRFEPPTHTGAEFKAKKAAGDIKKKNKVDPYAYIPLNTNNLNRRKAAKMKGQYKNLVGGAQKGAVKGKRGHKAGKRK